MPPYYTFFKPEPTSCTATPSACALGVGAFGSGSTQIDTTYDFRAQDVNGVRDLPGITSDANITIRYADVVNDSSFDAYTIDILGITELRGAGADLNGNGHLSILTDGWIGQPAGGTVSSPIAAIPFAEYTGDMRVGVIDSTQNDVTLVSPRAILDGLGQTSSANILGRNITLTAGNNGIATDPNEISGAGGVGTPADFLQIEVNADGGALGLLTVTDAQVGPATEPTLPLTGLTHGLEAGGIVIPGATTGTYGVFINQTTGALELNTVTTTGDASLTTSAGSIVDGRGTGGVGDTSAVPAPNVTANDVDLNAIGGSIGSETDALKVFSSADLWNLYAEPNATATCTRSFTLGYQDANYQNASSSERAVTATCHLAAQADHNVYVIESPGTAGFAVAGNPQAAFPEPVAAPIDLLLALARNGNVQLTTTETGVDGGGVAGSTAQATAGNDILLIGGTAYNAASGYTLDTTLVADNSPSTVWGENDNGGFATTPSSHGLVEAEHGNVTLVSADDVVTDPTSQILATTSSNDTAPGDGGNPGLPTDQTGNIDIYGDSHPASLTEPSGDGTVIVLRGTITPGAPVTGAPAGALGGLTRVFGNAGADTIIFDQTPLGGQTRAYGSAAPTALANYTDGVGSGTTTFTSATANFTSADVGQPLLETDGGHAILTGTSIVSVISPTQVVLSNAVTGSNIGFTVASHQYAPVGDGAGSCPVTGAGGSQCDDTFIVNRLPSMVTSLSTDAALADTLTLDGQSGSNTYDIYTSGSWCGSAPSANGAPATGCDNNYIVNGLGTHAPTDGSDTLNVYGFDSYTGNTPNYTGVNSSSSQDYATNDTFLLRSVPYINGETAARPSIYQGNPDQEAGGAFVALLHASLAQTEATGSGGTLSPDSETANFGVERVNYDSSMNGGVHVYSLGGNDYFAVDDNAAPTYLDGGSGDNQFQIGQIYGLRRTCATGSGTAADPCTQTSASNATSFGDSGGLASENTFDVATVATTQGWLSRGNSAPLTAQGGTGNNVFTVYSNQAELHLEGDGGNNLFIIRGFALAQTDPTTHNILLPGGCSTISAPYCLPMPVTTNGYSTSGKTDVRTGNGNNQVEYNMNAPVSVDGGTGFNKLIILGTEFADHIVVTANGIFGAGMSVTYRNIQVIEIDALEGDDTIDVLSTPPGVAVRVIGGDGSNQINVAGDVNGNVYSQDINGTSSTINNKVLTSDQYYADLVIPGVAMSVAQPGQGGVIITENPGGTFVQETGSGPIGSIDDYTVRLAQAPTSVVYVSVTAEPDTLANRTAVNWGDSILLATDRRQQRSADELRCYRDRLRLLSADDL